MLPYAAVCCRMLPYAERERTGVASCHSRPVLEKASLFEFFFDPVLTVWPVDLNLVNEEFGITFPAFF
jgi:hypothetical protein